MPRSIDSPTRPWITADTISPNDEVVPRYQCMRKLVLFPSVLECLILMIGASLFVWLLGS